MIHGLGGTNFGYGSRRLYYANSSQVSTIIYLCNKANKCDFYKGKNKNKDLIFYRNFACP